jgi:hypothetical protein
MLFRFYCSIELYQHLIKGRLMMKTTKKIVNLSVFVISIMTLGACSSLPFSGQSNVQEASVFEANQSNKHAELESEIEDFRTMKSSLSRLVSLESDLSFLLDEMSRFNEKNPIMYDTEVSTMQTVPALKSKVVYSTDGKKEYAAEELVDGWAKSLGAMSDRWNAQAVEMESLETSEGESIRDKAQIIPKKEQNIVSLPNPKFSSESQVEVASAKPILQVGDASKGKLFKGDEAKVTLSKFSDITDPQQIVGSLSNCKDWKVDSVQTFSLHLASYKTKKAAVDGWKKLDSKYSDIWCETSAKLAKVVVKGTEYLSLRVGGYDSKDKVLQLCSMVKERGDYCAVSTADGDILL